MTDDPQALLVEERRRRIEQALDELRPVLSRDGGGVELMGVDGRNIYVRMTGACVGCELATVTLGGLQKKMIEKLGELVRVIPHSLMPRAAMAAE